MVTPTATVTVAEAMQPAANDNMETAATVGFLLIGGIGWAFATRVGARGWARLAITGLFAVGGAIAAIQIVSPA